MPIPSFRSTTGIVVFCPLGGHDDTRDGLATISVQVQDLPLFQVFFSVVQRLFLFPGQFRFRRVHCSDRRCIRTGTDRQRGSDLTLERDPSPEWEADDVRVQVVAGKHALLVKEDPVVLNHLRRQCVRIDHWLAFRPVHLRHTSAVAPQHRG